MKPGDLVHVHGKEVGVIVDMISFEGGKNPQPIIMIGERMLLTSWTALEVINEAG